MWGGGCWDGGRGREQGRGRGTDSGFMEQPRPLCGRLRRWLGPLFGHASLPRRAASLQGLFPGVSLQYYRSPDASLELLRTEVTCRQVG